MGKNRKGNALLCVFAGETLCPEVVIVKTELELKKAIVEHWTGDADDEETASALEMIANWDFCEEGDICFDFEIGFAKFSDVIAWESI